MTVLADDAEATCFTKPGKRAVTLPSFAFGGQDGRGDSDRDYDDDDHRHRAAIVGLWNTEFLLGDGPDVYDQTFQQFHSDGLDLIVSNGVPPPMGNVCVGVWKHVGPRTIKLLHTTWNWDPTQPLLPLPSAQFAGTFVMEVTLVVAENGRTFRGKWSAASYDPSGVLVPGSEAAGVVRSTRISVD